MVYTDSTHIVADSLGELHAFAKKIGLRYCWFDNNANHPHYDFPLYFSNGYTRDELINRARKAGAKFYPTKFAMWRARNKNCHGN